MDLSKEGKRNSWLEEASRGCSTREVDSNMADRKVAEDSMDHNRVLHKVDSMVGDSRDQNMEPDKYCYMAEHNSLCKRALRSA